MKKKKDLFSGHSADYALFRPSYPETMYRHILDKISGRDQAWDAGTGNGQVARRLSSSFSQVLATDISKNQLGQAPSLVNVKYEVSRAAHCPLGDQSTDLITVGQALHWFSINEFFTEAKRVLKKKGMLACFAYNLLQCPPPLDKQIEAFYYETLDNYWPPERDLIESEYQKIAIPFTSTAYFETQVNWNSDQLLGYLSTWSAVKAYINKNGKDPLAEYEATIRSIVQSTVTIRFPVFLKLWESGPMI